MTNEQKVEGSPAPNPTPAQNQNQSQTPPKTEAKRRVYSIKDLDNFALHEIFVKLSLYDKVVLRKVNRQWKHQLDDLLEDQDSLFIVDTKRVSLDKMHEITVSTGSFKAITITSFIKLFPKLTHLGLSYEMDLQLFEMLAMKIRNLRNLTLNGESYQDIHLKASIEYSSDLNYLNLENCSVTDDGLHTVTSECSHLKVLILKNILEITGSFLNTLTTHFVHLEIHRCPKIDVGSWQALATGHAKHLSTIKLSGCPLTDESVNLIGRKLLRLTYIEVQVPKESKCSLGALSNLMQLETLIVDCEEPSAFTDKDFMDIQRGCCQLKTVGVTFGKPDGQNLTDKSFQGLFDNCPKLQTIWLQGTTQLTEASFKGLSKCPKLYEIYLHTLDTADKTVAELIKDCKLLRKTNFLKCKNIGKLTLNETVKQARRVPKNWFQVSFTDGLVNKDNLHSFIKPANVPKNLIIAFNK